MLETRNSGGSIINRWFRKEVKYILIAAADINGCIPESCVNYYRNESSKEGASGTVGQEDFETWVEFYLVPLLGKYENNDDRSIVVMDNASTHMGSRVQELIEGAGAYLLYTAPYSPDLNPIEKMFNLYKYFLKRHEHDFALDHVSTHWNAIHNSVSKDIAIKEYRKCLVPYSNSVLTSVENNEQLQIIIYYILSILID